MSILDSISRLDPILRSALVDYREERLSSSLLSERQQIHLSENAIKLMALVLLGRLGGDPPPPLDRYLREILHDGCPYTAGYAVEILDRSAGLADGSVFPIELGEFWRATSAWLAIVSRVGQATRDKTVLLLRKQIFESAGVLMKAFLELLQALGSANVWSLPKGTKELFISAPYLLIARTQESSGVPILFALSHVERSHKKQLKAIYQNWPTRYRLTISLEPGGRGLTGEIAKSIQARLPKGRTPSGSPQDRSALPLLADCHPAIVRLASHLIKNTAPKTWEDLWAKTLPATAYKEFHGLLPHRRLDWLQTNQDQVREAIVLDCIERDPIRVLLDVSIQEGQEELGDYVRQLSPDDAEVILERTQENSGWSVGTSRDSDAVMAGADMGVAERHRFDLYQRLLAIEVAKLMGFKVSDELALKGIRFYLQEGYAHLEKARRASDRDRLIAIVLDVNRLMESVLHELYLFHSFFLAQLARPASDATALASEEAWLKQVQNVRRWPLGETVNQLTSLLRDTELNEFMVDRIGYGNPLVDEERWKFALSLAQVVNTVKHSMDGKAEVSELYALITTKNVNTKVVRNLRGYVVEFVENAVEVLKSLAGDGKAQVRIYPYKVTFSVYSITAQGVQRCSYYTDAHDEDTTSQTLIYTDEAIDLSQVYFCLPNRLRQSRHIWMKPLLLPLRVVTPLT